MSSRQLQYSIVRVASFLAPSCRRSEWLREWRSELWYVPRREAVPFVLGAFQDALWLRRNLPYAERLSLENRTRNHLESPLACLALLATLALLSILMAVGLAALSQKTSSLLKVRDVPWGSAVMLIFSCLLVPGTLAVWRTPASRDLMPWSRGLRQGVFLALKITLLQPIMLCGFIIQILLGPGGLAGIGFVASFILALRWVITDQQQRCPVCLRLLTNPVRIGNPSKTFLEWYGAESMCSHGHGLLHVAETSTSYFHRAQWLYLDSSWSGLFPEAFKGE